MADGEQTAQTARNTQADGVQDAAGNQGEASEAQTPQFEPLTVTSARLRHSTDRAKQAAFSRATALLEAVAGNQHTPLEDRVFLAETMPFPNVLVKLSEDPSPEVRRAVAANRDDKNWLVGRLTKDEVPEVRDEALRNPQTSWKMRMEGAQNPEVDAQTLDFLSRLGVELEPDAPRILSTMVRRGVALNPNAGAETIERLKEDPVPEVAKAAQRR